MKPLIVRGMDYYCPVCMLEMYLPSVYDLIKHGGNCPWCEAEIRSGETIEWTTLDDIHLLTCDMSNQHISNILHLRVGEPVKEILKNELKYRGIKPLPYVKYYDDETESQLSRNDK